MSTSFVTPSKGANAFTNLHTIGSDKLEGDRLLFTTFQVVKDLQEKCCKMVENLDLDKPRARALIAKDIKSVLDIVKHIDGNLEKHMRLDRKFHQCTRYLSSLRADTNAQMRLQERITTPAGAKRKAPEEVRLSQLKPPPPPAKNVRPPAKKSR